ncbi:MAG: hypothetical protein RLZZ461_1464 [Planctomycetota bacterium]|jgi:glucose/arabinose dehydrogenase
MRRPISCLHLFTLAGVCCLPLAQGVAQAAPPAGFTLEPWPGDWNEIVGIVPVGDGRFVAWERGGVGWMVGPDGIASVEPLFDLHDEVGAWRDHGLLGLALDPDYSNTGDIYLLYVVDRHHLLYAGTDLYDPDADEYNAATIARITRYTATAESDFSIVDPASRHILIGDSITTGIPVTHQAHVAGSLAFGRDGTLLATIGDSGAYGQVDTGGDVIGGWTPMALRDGILRPEDDIGAFRAQKVDSLNGKVLRLDPENGDGVASNPWFDPKAPDSARSRVWAIGLRHAYRFSMVPGTGSLDPKDADPGTIVYGDVGWGTREEIGLIDRPGLNLGWPLYEGLDPLNGYWKTDFPATWAPNAMRGEGCDEYQRIRDLLIDANDRDDACSNPCDPSYLKATALGGATLENTWAGWAGDFYYGFLGVDGKWADFTFEVPDGKVRRYGLRYANGGSTNRPMRLSIDGKTLADLDMPSTGDWRQWRTIWFELALPPGPHTFRVESTVSNGPNIDRIEAPDLPFTPVDGPPTFTHHRPLLDWKHNSVESRVPTFSAVGDGEVERMGTDACPVDGAGFGGNCVTGGAMIDDPGWPAEWRGYYFADFTFGWIRVLRFGEDLEPLEVAPFDSTFLKATSITYDPHSRSMLAIRWSQNPIRIVPPVPVCPADLNQDGLVSVLDLGLLLSQWNTDGNGDLNGDGVVEQIDLGLLLSSWGPCTP